MFQGKKVMLTKLFSNPFQGREVWAACRF